MQPNSSSHYQQLRRALQQELQRSSVEPVSSPVSMKKFIPWLVAAPLAAASLAGVLLWQQPNTLNNLNSSNRHLGLSDFISAAQAETENHPNEVLHQKIQDIYYVDGTPVTTMLERWNGDKNYADIIYAADGSIEDKHVEVYDAVADKQRGYALHAVDPITNPPTDEGTNLAGSSIVCFLNAKDFPELSEAQVAELTQAMSESRNIDERMSLLQTMIDHGKVTDLGVHDGQRGLEIKAHTQTFQYWFDPATYSLKSYKELNAAGETQHEQNYLVDEYLAEAETNLPIFSDLAGLTEIHLYADPVGADGNPITTRPSGCYNADGEKVADINTHVTIDENGEVTAFFTDEDLMIQ